MRYVLQDPCMNSPNTSGSSGEVYSLNQAIHRFWLNDEDVSSVLENRRTLQHMMQCYECSYVCSFVYLMMLSQLCSVVTTQLWIIN